MLARVLLSLEEGNPLRWKTGRAAATWRAGAEVQLFVRGNAILWNKRVFQERNLWQRLRSPITSLGTGPKAWVLSRFPGAMHYLPPSARIRFLKNHLPPEGAWWLRNRVESCLPIHFGTSVVESRDVSGRVHLRLRSDGKRSERHVQFDRVIAGSGFKINVERLDFLDPKLLSAIDCRAGAPILDCKFQASVPGLCFAGPASAMSFGPLFRFVAGAEFTAQTISAHLASRSSTT